MKLTTENGHTHDLDMLAIRELQKAKNARDAETIFNRFAPHVPAKDRCGIWFAVDAVDRRQYCEECRRYHLPPVWHPGMPCVR